MKDVRENVRDLKSQTNEDDDDDDDDDVMLSYATMKIKSSHITNNSHWKISKKYHKF
jgi:hypothetical protein